MDSYTQRAAGAGASFGTEESASRMSEEAAEPEAPAGGWKLESLSVRKAENGGVIVSCSKRRERSSEKQSYEDTYQSKDYAFGSKDEALAYIGQELDGADGSGNTAMNAPAVATRG